MAKKKNKKVVRYRRPLNINVGMIIFFIIFIYLVFSVYTYLKREKIQFYEVGDKITTYDEYLESHEMARKRQTYSVETDDED